MELATAKGGSVTLFLADGDKPEKKAVEELKTMMELGETVEQLKNHGGFFGSQDSGIRQVIVTPDFHKGAGIPIGTVMMTEGFVIPQAMGNDINCGMRVYTTDLKEEEIRSALPSLIPEIRRVYFEGGRNIPMNGTQREAMLREGLTGLLETCGEAAGEGIWQLYDPLTQEKELDSIAFRGSVRAEDTEGLADYIGNRLIRSYDDQIGSIGGGNHFVEMQKVEEIYDGQTANAWGIKKGGILIMIHTGSLTIGHHSGLINRIIIKEQYPKGLVHPGNGLYLLPRTEESGSAWRRFWSTTNNAANFGFANRLFLGLMLQHAVSRKTRAFGMKLLYDSPHNYIWKRKRMAVNALSTERAPAPPEAWRRWRTPPLPITGSL